ncbi:protein kinase domain-containing protein [Actinomadura chibensis]|uniref:protein kinase domain-containing protein n=1 Tax=Actinomadura chibensis TaxID=392828 RepID=UPI00082F2ABA|nr:protein kinase [Actinomadura chibensis]
MPGPTLADTVEQHGPLPEAPVLALADGLARALRAVHASDLIHRNLKPPNMLVTIDGPPRDRLRDRPHRDASVAPRTGALVGSPPFMAPEQVQGGQVTAACDVFSLGSVLAYAATGRRPSNSGADGLHALLYRVLRQPPDLAGPSGLVRDLAESCLTKESERRHTPDEVRATLPPPALAPGRDHRRDRPHRWPARPGSPHPRARPASAVPSAGVDALFRQGRVTALGHPVLDAAGAGGTAIAATMALTVQWDVHKADGASAGTTSAGTPARGDVPVDVVGTQNRRYIRSKKDKP